MGREELDLRKDWLRLWPGHATMVEPAKGSTFGTPDASLFHAEFSGWVEFKVAEASGDFKCRAPQLRWHRAFLEAGGSQALFAVLDREGFWLLPSYLVAPKEPNLTRNVYKLGGRKVRWLEADPFALPLMCSRIAELNRGK